MLRKHEDRANNDKSREEDTRPIKERLISAVCPLAEQPYEKQLETKHKEVTDLMDTLKYVQGKCQKILFCLFHP